jgi:uncharacterized integral membrane protein
MVERDNGTTPERSPEPAGPTNRTGPPGTPEPPGTPDPDRGPARTAPGAPTAPEPRPEPTEPTARPAPPAPPPAAHREVRRMRRTRISGLWVGVTLAAVVLLILLVFIIENGTTVDIAFFGAHGRLPLGVALLLAAICGVLVVAVPGYGRIIQLRRAMKRVAGSTPDRRRR